MWELIIGILVVYIIIKIGVKAVKFLIWLAIALGVVYLLVNFL